MKPSRFPIKRLICGSASLPSIFYLLLSVVEALRKAGIEISPEAMQQALGMDSEDGGEKK